MTGTAIYPVLGHPLYNQHLRVEVVGSRIELGEREVLLKPTEVDAEAFWELDRYPFFMPDGKRQVQKVGGLAPRARRRNTLPPEHAHLWAGTQGELAAKLAKSGLGKTYIHGDFSVRVFEYLMGQSVPMPPACKNLKLVDDEGAPTELGRLCAARYLFRLMPGTPGAARKAS